MRVSIGGVTDPDGDPVSITIVRIAQDEPLRFRRNGLCADGAGVGSASADLRAERLGKGDGRVYRLSFGAYDGRGGQCMGDVTVCVPTGSAHACTDQGPRVDSTSPGCAGACVPVCSIERGLSQALCPDERLPADLVRLIGQARRRLARGTDTDTPTAGVKGAVRLLERAARLADRVGSNGHISAGCATSVGQMLGDAHQQAEQLLTTR